MHGILYEYFHKAVVSNRHQIDSCSKRVHLYISHVKEGLVFPMFAKAVGQLGEDMEL